MAWIADRIAGETGTFANEKNGHIRILIVDDSSGMRMIVRRALKQAGFEGNNVLEADSAITALEILRSEEIDLVLTDWNIPEMSGLELMEAVNSEDIGIPIGVVSSRSSAEMIEAARRAGAKVHVDKAVHSRHVSRSTGSNVFMKTQPHTPHRWAAHAVAALEQTAVGLLASGVATASDPRPPTPDNGQAWAALIHLKCNDESIHLALSSTSDGCETLAAASYTKIRRTYRMN